MRFNATKYRVSLNIFIIALLAFGAGFYAGTMDDSDATSVNGAAIVVNKDATVDVDFAPFWETWETIDELYIDPDTAGAQERVWGAIQGLVASLDDPYSVFFPPQESEFFESEIRGNFSGVGMEIEMYDQILTVVSPLKNTPAEHAGIQAGDKIIQIDDVSTIGLTLNEAVSLIRGEIGTDVVLIVVRDGSLETTEFTITRDTINIPTIETEKRAEEGVFIIRLFNFSGNSDSLFREALREFTISGYDKLIVDLRNNTGGFLESSIDMASWFLPVGKVITTEDFGDKAPANAYRSKGYDIFNENLKFVILVNRGSASASEIFAGALQEHGEATLVGEKTFGKGSVQQLVDITPETSLKITVARWLTPEGKSISDGGLTPDVEIKFTGEDIEKNIDTQLEKAIEILLNE